MSPDVEAWIAGFLKVPAHRTPRIQGLLDLRDWTRGQWPEIHAYALTFLRERGDEAIAAGFGCLELLGVHRGAGAARVDSTGFLIQYRPVTVVTVAPKLVTFSNGLVYRGNFNAAESVPIWEFRPPERATGRR